MFRMIKKYLSYSPLPIRYFYIAGGLFSTILVISSYLSIVGSENYISGNLNHSILTYCKYLVWPLFVPGMSYYLQKEQSKTSKALQLALVILLFAVMHTLLSNIVYYATLWPLVGTKALLVVMPEFVEYFLMIIISRVLDMIGILALVSGIMFYKSYEEDRAVLIELKSELRQAELSALRNQLKPHFLFNTLNTISSLIDQDTKKAQKVLSKIAHLLRTNLDHSKKEKISLEEELEVIQDYLEIESERFNDRLKVIYTIDENVELALVPNLILQPLVENSIKHGVHKTSEKITVHISAKANESRLTLSVIDDGPSSTATKANQGVEGVGISNIRNRLSLLYGDQSSLETMVSEGEKFEVIIQLPLEFKE